MGERNFLVEGVSCSGKTTVCDELARRGHHAVHGDRELAYQGDPLTGDPLAGAAHEHHIWDVAKVRTLAADGRLPISFFCGGSRNNESFLDVFDAVFLLEVDRQTLVRRLDARAEGEWGAAKHERDLVLRLYETNGDVPRDVVSIDATQPVEKVADEILRYVISIRDEA